jgi:hypothetical protein
MKDYGKMEVVNDVKQIKTLVGLENNYKLIIKESSWQRSTWSWRITFMSCDYKFKS